MKTKPKPIPKPIPKFYRDGKLQPTIRTSKKVAMEIFEFIAGGVCGHGSVLSKRASRVYRKWRLVQFKPLLVYPGIPKDAY